MSGMSSMSYPLSLRRGFTPDELKRICHLLETYPEISMSVIARRFKRSASSIETINHKLKIRPKRGTAGGVQ